MWWLTFVTMKFWFSVVLFLFIILEIELAYERYHQMKSNCDLSVNIFQDFRGLIHCSRYAEHFF